MASSYFRRAALALAVSTSLTITPIFAESKQEEAERHLKVLSSAKAENKAKIEAIEGIAALGQIKKSFAEPAVPILKDALKSKDGLLRAAAAEAIGKVDPDEKEEIVKTLIGLVKDDKNVKVREGAAKGLGALGTDAKAALPVLREAMKDAKANENKKDERIYMNVIQQIVGRKKN
jgi:HEAT repeat protein